ncbi:hypothetical protein HRH25_09570 [Flavisolibacter sp. BT320]|nr:hypothetical protein [Flavisolibacter longurius]
MRKQLLSLLFLAVSHPLFSQSDSVLFAAAMQSKQAANAGDPLYYGRQYVGYPFAAKGIPFYGSEDWQKGDIIYRDVAYSGILLKYDLVKDEVIALHPNGFTPVVLFSPRIQAFTLGESRFIYLTEVETAPHKAGIYEVLSTGPLTLYAKRTMLLNESIVSNVLEREFVRDYSFYVQMDGKLHPIKNEKAILQLVDDKKKESKAALKAAGIKYRKTPEAALRTIVDFYNQTSR